MLQYRKRPVVIEAIQFDGSKDNLAEIFKLSNSIGVYTGNSINLPTVLSIKTLEGIIKANIGDWIIKDIVGELYPCKPDIFEATYEAV